MFRWSCQIDWMIKYSLTSMKPSMDYTGLQGHRKCWLTEFSWPSRPREGKSRTHISFHKFGAMKDFGNDTLLTDRSIDWLIDWLNVLGKTHDVNVNWLTRTWFEACVVSALYDVCFSSSSYVNQLENEDGPDLLCAKYSLRQYAFWEWTRQHEVLIMEEDAGVAHMIA